MRKWVIASQDRAEALFLTTFVRISQNSMAALADKRADLDSQPAGRIREQQGGVVRDGLGQKMDTPAGSEAELSELATDPEKRLKTYSLSR